MLTGRIKFANIAALLLTAMQCVADSVEVAVRQYTSCGDGVLQLVSESYCQSGGSYKTVKAPVLDGFIFVGWESSADDPFDSRDSWQRALESASFVPYQPVSLTARYVANSVDSDGDGVADGHELYWYGDLSQSADSDTDGDGLCFADELECGTNPHFANALQFGRVKKAKSELIQLNPYHASGFIVRSDDGELLPLTTNFVSVGDLAITPKLSPTTSPFAYWMVGGVPVRDAFGQALDQVSIVMSETELEIVAVTERDEATRQKLYWYGTADVDMESDTDGDGLTFAEEIERGTSPHFPDSQLVGRVRKAASEKVLLNPFGFSGYVVCAEDGELIVAETNYVATGDLVVSPLLSPNDSNFAYWLVNGVAARDAFGRAVNQVKQTMTEAVLELVAVGEADEVTRQKLYWYGSTDVDMNGDSDGDGFTFAQELANGTNPLFPDSKLLGKVSKTASEAVDVNGQGYEKVDGIVIDGEYIRIFDSDGNAQAGTSVTFKDADGNPVAVWPVSVDLNGDGLFDVIVCSDFGQRIFLNVGNRGNPAFKEDSAGDFAEPALAWRDMNSTEKIGYFDLDVPPTAALSATTNGNTLLVSDEAGRIWYYLAASSGEDASGAVFALQHKVWGGSYAGFAQGLKLAAVDWDEDGDLDCLCGTADGKLMLLRNPKAGHPANLRAASGADNVLLTWDPSRQSRVRGYKVYRSVADAGTWGTALGDRSQQCTTTLPKYCDFPPEVGEYDYKVSSVSRFYTVGNSTPTVTESPASEPVRATVGTVRFFWNDVAVKQGENAQVMLSIENSLNYDVAGKTQVVTYDPAYLTPLKIVKTGLTENVIYEESVAEGKWTISLKSGNLAAGGGKFFTLVFDTLKAGTTMVGEATVSIAARTESAPYRLGDVTGDGVVDTLDLRELARLKSAAGRKWTANQLKAGDFNGNGLLDNADYQALRDLLKEKGLL